MFTCAVTLVSYAISHYVPSKSNVFNSPVGLFVACVMAQHPLFLSTSENYSEVEHSPTFKTDNFTTANPH